MANYVKLFGSILDSTVWKLPAAISKVWVTMMAMADRDGVVEASLPGLARRAFVTDRVCQKAISIFLNPDPHSKTPDNEGRRIEVVARGWRLLNYEAYRELQSLDDRKAKNAERQRRFRERHAAGVTLSVTDSNAPSRSVTPSDASCSALSDLGSASPHEPPDQTRTPARSNGHARLWEPFEWCRRYGVAWAERYQRIAYGDAGDSKGCSNLAAVFEALPESERLAAQQDATRMFAEFLARDGREAQRRHPFVFFVQEWGGLRVPAAPPPRDARAPAYRKL